MFHWILALFGLEPTKNSPLDPTPSRPAFSNSLDAKNWPEGSQLRKQLRYHEPDGWAHCHWSWRSNGYIDHPGSLHPKPDKAECRCCLGVLKCQVCGKILRPSTKTSDMKAQLDRPCPDFNCSGSFVWVTCQAKSFHFVVVEDGVQYSIWEHSGHHDSHPHPPLGRRPPRSVPVPRRLQYLFIKRAM
jgi:hypothetical protein